MHGDFFAAWDARVQNALVSECLNEARDCIDINRDGNILFKPRGDPDPIPRQLTWPISRLARPKC
jgi:hypothetical protein